MKVLPFDRRFLFATCVVFCFALSTSVLLKLQREPPPAPAPRDTTAERAELHSLVTESLVLFGLNGEDLIADEAAGSDGPAADLHEPRREIFVESSFSLLDWLDSLRASLEGSGAFLVTRQSSERFQVEVRYRPEGHETDLLVESLKLVIRPSREELSRRTGAGGSRVALVIDDLGQNPEHFRRLAELGIPLTLSILPHLPFSTETAKAAGERKFETILHLPMEPIDYPGIDPGPGALLSAMTKDQLHRELTTNLDALPGAVGVNNHMGSRLTSNHQAMEVIMEELRARGLYFLDSKTSNSSVAFETAYRYRLPAAKRDIFLDADDDADFIRGQLRRLIAIARKEGSAIGIGHPYGNTLDVLEEMRPELLASGVEWVPLSQLVQESAEGELSAWER